MSLHLGHIPPHVRAQDLERVFQGFGPCNLQLKEGYGFAVYRFPSDAESALRALRGRNICGAPISLDWSNRQPKPLQRPQRPNQVYDPPHRRRNFRGLEDRKEFSAYNGPGRHRDNVFDRGPGYDAEERREVLPKEGVTDEANRSEPNPNSVGNDRWEESVADEFDRYEPYENRANERENNQMDSSNGSPYNGSNERNGRKRRRSIDEADKKTFNGELPPPACYNCGEVGHIKRNCPEARHRQETSGKLRRYRDELSLRGRNDRQMKMRRISSQGRLGASRDQPLFRESREINLGPSRNFVGRGGSRPMLRTKLQAKERREQQSKTQKEASKTRRRRPSLSSDSSSRSSSRSNSRTSRSKSYDRSPSTSSRSLSASSRSRSASSSSYSKSKSSRPRSTSRSTSNRSLSPSSSPKNMSRHGGASGNAPQTGNLERSVNPIANHNNNNELNQESLKESSEELKFSASSSEYRDDGTASENLEDKIDKRNSTRISSEELVTALKHYGLPVPEGSESKISVEGYFGAARLWPWEMIHYRRLKKGPISTENYARRLEQNREFGIVDKYVRSSSGWGEPDQIDP